jgi:hypothetical protein
LKFESLGKESREGLSNALLQFATGAKNEKLKNSCLLSFLRNTRAEDYMSK